MEQTPSRLVHQQQGAAPPPLKPFCPPIVIVFPVDAARSTPTAPVCATCVTRSYTALQARQQQAMHRRPITTASGCVTLKKLP